MPPRHDGARQALSELRRILNADWHCIRRNLVRRNNKIALHQRYCSHTHRFEQDRCHHLMTSTLTTIAVCRGLLIRGSLAMLDLGCRLVRAAIAKEIDTVPCQNEQGDDDDNQAGAKAAHGW